MTLSSEGGLVLWQDNTIDGASGTGIAARRLDADLVPQGAPFRVNDKTAGDQLAPQIVTLRSGVPLAVWQSRLGARQSIVARLLGTNFSPEIQISPDTTTNLVKYKTNWYGFSRNKYRKKTFKLKDRIHNIRELNSHPSVLPLPDGGAVIVYQSVRKHETNSWALDRRVVWNGARTITNDVLIPTRVLVDWMQDVYFQRLSASGAKIGPEVQANQHAEFNQRSPTIASLANGNLVIAWVSESRRSFVSTDNFQVEIFARLFNAQGEPLGDEFRVSEGEPLINANPAVASLASGGFTVAWSQQEGALSRRWDVVSRAFNANGAAAGSTELVNTYRTGDQFGPRIVSVGDNQLVVWTSLGQDGSRDGVFGRVLSAGVPDGAEFPVNQTTISRQMHPALAADSQGRVLAVWTSYTGDSAFDLFGRTYTLPLPVAPPEGGAVVEASFAAASASASASASALRPGGASASRSGQTGPVTGASAGNGVLLLGVGGSAAGLELHWNTVPGRRYQVETSTDLRAWAPVGRARTAANSTDAQRLDSGQAAAFYRVVQLR